MIKISNFIMPIFKGFTIIIFPLLLIWLTSFSMQVLAQSITGNPIPEEITATRSSEEKEIETLKEKIATKVAELRAKNLKAVSGTVENIDDRSKSINIRSENGEDIKINVDPDLTKYYQIGQNLKKEIAAEKVKTGAYILATGVISEKAVDANFIYLDEAYFVATGKITDVNSDDYYLNVITSDKENYILDIEKTTKQSMMNPKTLAIESVGFSKIKEGDTTHFVVKKIALDADSQSEENAEATKLNRFSAVRILIIQQEY